MTLDFLKFIPLEYTRNRHLSCLKRFLKDEPIDKVQVWVAVGYFKHGDGKEYFKSKKPFSEEEWARLLTATNRK